jgi:hypothetical protein
VTAPEPVWSNLWDLLPRFLELKASLPELGSNEEGAAKFDELAQDMEVRVRLLAETALWCRQSAGRLRGEDVPGTIYPEPGEDPADTARWKKWRMPEPNDHS